jgi:hypothetical protein
LSLGRFGTSDDHVGAGQDYFRIGKNGVSSKLAGLVAHALDATFEQPTVDDGVASLFDQFAQAGTWGVRVLRSLNPDWESVDGELCQFLAKIGGLGSDGEADDPDLISPISMITAAVTAAILGRLTLGRRRRYLLLRLLKSRPAGLRRRTLVGPWPLESP